MTTSFPILQASALLHLLANTQNAKQCVVTQGSLHGGGRLVETELAIFERLQFTH